MTPETLEHMAQAAEALANAAGRMGAEEEEEPDHHQARARQQNQGSGRGDEDEKKLPPGEKAVRRAVDLCTSIDKKRAGFFYYMRALYPSVPPGKNDGTTWSRDARATRDRVCFHCEADEIAGLADDEDARKKFEELEHAFERHERLR